jgi:site-specific DNA-methyltransferase (adenine-specific)
MISGPTKIVVFNECAFGWLESAPPSSVHAVVTDPPYAVKEYDAEQLAKRERGHGGVWRIPPAIGGSVRSPVPRFTALSRRERERLVAFFERLGPLLLRVLRPGGHAIMASNAMLALPVFSALAASGLEFRGEVIRLVRTLRGGNRPKNAHERYPGVCSTARGAYEPWGVFRKPLGERTLERNLARWGTGGLRRDEAGLPFVDVIPSAPASKAERRIAPHPSLKPQSFLRCIVRAALPLGEGVLLDPFMGSGSTIAAARAVGYEAVGLERDAKFFTMAKAAIPALAAFTTETKA